MNCLVELSSITDAERYIAKVPCVWLLNLVDFLKKSLRSVRGTMISMVDSCLSKLYIIKTPPVVP